MRLSFTPIQNKGKITALYTRCDTCATLSEAYGTEAMKKTSVFHWHKRFKEDRGSVEGDETSGRPKSQRTDVTVEKARNLVHSDRRFKDQSDDCATIFDRETVT
jgi:hypothetical protein